MNEQSIFTAALEQDPRNRSAFLDQACGADAKLRQRLETLAQRANTEQWVRVAECLREMEIGLKGNLNKQMLTDALALVTYNLPDDRARN